MGRLEGREIVVTGGTGALGRAAVRLFVKEGARVHIPAFERKVDEKALGFSGAVSVTTGIDLSDAKAVQGFYEKLPPLWASVHIAGGFAFSPLESTTEEVLRQQFEMNAASAYLCCQAATANMRKASQGGRLVNVSAKPALEPRAGANVTAYAMAKAGVAALTAALAEELKKDRIAVNAIAPSIIDTPANRKDMPDADFGTWVKPEAIANLLLQLCDPGAEAVSGAIVPIYGWV